MRSARIVTGRMSEPGACNQCGATTEEFRIADAVDVGRTCSDACAHALHACGYNDRKSEYCGRSS